MSKIEFKLQNVVLSEDYNLKEYWNLAYRSHAPLFYNWHEGCFIIPQNTVMECFTYLNSISLAKWEKYTKVNEITLNLKIQGKVAIQLFGHYKENNRAYKEWMSREIFECNEPSYVSISFDKNPLSQVGAFEIFAIGESRVYEGYYSTTIEEGEINDVNIVISTTTFNQERYIKKNINLMEKDFFGSNEPAAKKFKMQVVDNGRTLDVNKHSTDNIKIFPNLNTGGAGGFTRGMIEALDSENVPTHIILTDDDVNYLPESFLRVYSLSALLKEEYDSHIISGAMLYMEQPHIQHEDIGILREDGSLGPRKPKYDLNIWYNVLENEQELAPKKNSYAGWWYCCIPMKTIDREDLPIPLFIRGDDVEWSVKQDANFITLSGICVWHKGFIGKYNAALELYLVHRNCLIVQAMSGIYSGVDFVKRIDDFFWKEIRRFGYQNCELLLDAIEDFLDGPGFMMTPQGAKIAKQKNAKNEKMVPLEELNLEGVNLEGLYHYQELSRTRRFLYRVTRNGHIGFDFLLNKQPNAIAYDWFDVPYRQFRRKTLIAVNEEARTGHIRTISRRKYKELLKRRKCLLKRYEKERASITEEYKKASVILKSEDFWKEYLKIY